MTKSKKPGKQRKAQHAAPLHRRQKLMSAHLSTALRKQLGKRSMQLRKGDEVRIMRGKHRGTTGKVEKVDLKELKVYLENMKRKKVTGEERPMPFQASNLILTNVSMDDKERKKIVERKKPKK